MNKMRSLKIKRHALIAFLFLAIFILSVCPVIAGDGGNDVLNEDCSINWDVFNRDWKRYSDLDEQIPLESRSWEAQQYYAILSQIIDLKLQVFFLKRDMEVDRLMRLELRDHKIRLVQNIKVNLLKSFWRLSYITYDTIKGASGLGDSYEKIFTSAEPIKKLGALLKTIRGITPSSSRIAINTNNTSGKIATVQLTAALETLESLGSPKDIGKAVFDDTVKQVLPSADLTPEEISILHTQHINNRTLDYALQESYKENRERRIQAESLETQIKQLEQELVKWEGEEKSRVAELLISDCKNRKKGDGGAPQRPPVSEGEEEEPSELKVDLSHINSCLFDARYYEYRQYAGGSGAPSEGYGGFYREAKGSFSGNTFIGSMDTGTHEANITVTVDSTASRIISVRMWGTWISTSTGDVNSYDMTASDITLLEKGKDYLEYYVDGVETCNHIDSIGSINKMRFSEGGRVWVDDSFVKRWECNGQSLIKVRLYTSDE